jgi:RNA polymerase sigma factor (TIGR02999 family)
MSAVPAQQITELLEAARGGDQNAYARVVALLYQDLRGLARAITRDPAATLNPTALLHETYLKLTAASGAPPLNREHFLALAARAMRQVLCNHAREQFAQKRGGDALLVTFDPHDAALSFQADQLLDIDRALETIEREEPHLVRVVECRMFAGMTETETAKALDLPLRTLQRQHADARERLRQQLRTEPRASAPRRGDNQAS